MQQLSLLAPATPPQSGKKAPASTPSTGGDKSFGDMIGKENQALKSESLRSDKPESVRGINETSAAQATGQTPKPSKPAASLNDSDQPNVAATVDSDAEGGTLLPASVDSFTPDGQLPNQINLAILDGVAEQGTLDPSLITTGKPGFAQNNPGVQGTLSVSAELKPSNPLTSSISGSVSGINTAETAGVAWQAQTRMSDGLSVSGTPLSGAVSEAAANPASVVRAVEGGTANPTGTLINDSAGTPSNAQNVSKGQNPVQTELLINGQAIAQDSSTSGATASQASRSSAMPDASSVVDVNATQANTLAAAATGKVDATRVDGVARTDMGITAAMSRMNEPSNLKAASQTAVPVDADAGDGSEFTGLLRTAETGRPATVGQENAMSRLNGVTQGENNQGRFAELVSSLSSSSSVADAAEALSAKAESSVQAAQVKAGAEAKSAEAALPRAYVSSLGLPVDDAQWSNQLGQKLMWMSARNIQNAELHLNPAELGPIEVRIQLGSDQSSINFNTQNQSVRELLESNIHRLREMLNAPTSEQADAQSGRDGFNRSQDDGRQGSGGENSRFTGEADFASGGPSSNDNAPSSKSDPDALLDAYV